MNPALQAHIESERRRLRQAHAVLCCLAESLAHSEAAEGTQHADVAEVASELLAMAIERLDLVVLRAVREPRPTYGRGGFALRSGLVVEAYG